MSLTKRQRKILDFVKDWSETRGYAPSLMEIARHFGLRSPATVHKHLRNLEAKGVLRRRWNHARSIEILPEEGTSPSFDLALAGMLTADEPPIMKPAEQTVPVPAGLVGQAARPYVLQILGDGFRPQLLANGDLLVIEEDSDPAHDAVVIAVLGGARSRIRRCQRLDGQVSLHPIGDLADPLPVDARDVRIHARVLGSLRQY